MSFEALARVRDVTGVPGPAALLLLFILADYAGADGCCYPSQATLGERTGLSVRAVRANLSLLRHAGLIEQTQRRRKDGSRTSDRFRLLYYRPEQAAETAACELAPRPSKSREKAKRQNPPQVQRLNSTGLPASAAGLTSFEPVIETESARTACAVREADATGLSEGMPAVSSTANPEPRGHADDAAQALWSAAAARLRLALSAGAYRSWIEPAYLGAQGQALYLVAATGEAVRRLRNEFRIALREAWLAVDPLKRDLPVIARAEFERRQRAYPSLTSADRRQ